MNAVQYQASKRHAFNANFVLCIMFGFILYQSRGIENNNVLNSNQNNCCDRLKYTVGIKLSIFFMTKYSHILFENHMQIQMDIYV